jgi:hypothetical protein
LSVLSLVLLVTQFACSPALGVKTYEGRVELGEGETTFWKVHDDGRTLRFQVEVVEGGPIDVYLSLIAPYGDISALRGYEFEGVSYVSESYELAHFSVYLVVDNSEDHGVLPGGNVTVDVRWNTGATASWTFVLIVTLLALVLSVVIVTLRRRRSASSRAAIDHEVVHVDRRPTGGRGRPGRGRTRGPPGGSQWCRSCGAEMSWDGEAGWWACSYCGRELGPGG